MTERISLLHICQYLEIGGLESLIVAMSIYGKKRGKNIGVLCLNGYDPSYKIELERRGIPVYLVRKFHRFDLTFFFRVARLLRTKSVRIAHAHGGCFLYTVLFSMMSGVDTVIYTQHGLPVDRTIKGLLEDNLAALRVDGIVAVSDEVSKNLKQRLPMAKRRIHLILNGVDTDKFKPEEDQRKIKEIKQRLGIPAIAKIIGSVGRLEYEKNYQMLIRAFKRLESKYKDEIHLVLIGEGRHWDRLQSLANEMGLITQVSFLGMQYHIESLLPMFDIFALSSRTEGTSISLLEAQAVGIPAVVTNVGGNPKVIKHGSNGILCPPDDPDMMADAFDSLLSNGKLYNEMKKRARMKVVGEFSIGAMMDRYETLYRDTRRSRQADPDI